MIREYYRTSTPSLKRYVRKAIRANLYEWCEVGEDRRFNTAAGECLSIDLPDDIRQLCDAAEPNGFYTCEWPL